MDDAVSEYHSFNETYEEILYKFMYKPTRTVRPAHPLTAKIYFEYGVLLVELKRLEDARSALNNALRWNPMYAKVMFEYAETYKAVEAWEQFLELTKRAFKVSFRAKDLARCYRNVAFYFVEKELYDAAASCLEVSTIFDPESKTAHAELYYIHQVTDGKAKALPPDELKKVANEYGFPLGADGDVVGLAFALGKDAFEKGQKEAANYFLSIAYELTKAPEVEELLAQVGLQEE